MSRSFLIDSLENRLLFASLGVKPGAGTGLVGNYFSDNAFANFAAARVDSVVNFNWAAAPVAGAPADGFSARWTGRVQAVYGETYRLYIPGGEPSRLYVGGNLLIDNWSGSAGEKFADVPFAPGELYDVKLETINPTGPAAVALSWSSPSTPKATIPSSQLYVDAGWVNHGWLTQNIGRASFVTSRFATSVSSGGAYTINSSGTGTTGSEDQSRFLYQTVNGDGTITARIDSISAKARASLMIRGSTGSNAVTISVELSNLLKSISRPSVGAQAATTPHGLAGAGIWLRIQRDNAFFRIYRSATGADGSWTLVNTASAPDMPDTALYGLSVASGSDATLASATFSNINIAAVVPLGAGVDQVVDWALGNVYMDLAKQARPWQTFDGADAALDAQRNPLSDFQGIFQTIPDDNVSFYNGVYKLSFNGQAGSLGSWGGITFTNQVYNAATNKTTVDANFAPSANTDYFTITFQNTKRTPTSPLNSGLTNISLIRPGTTTDPTGLFNSAYFAHLKQFSVLRTMDMSFTNYTSIVDWSQRPLPAESNYLGKWAGIPLEHIVYLANVTGKDLWLNIPATASQDYMTKLSQLVLYGSDGVNAYTSPQANPVWPGLSKDRVVYLEYSNEVWNSQFDQYWQNRNAAFAEVQSGTSDLNFDNLPIWDTFSQDIFAWRRTAKKALQISDTFKAVWGAGAINTRVRTILAGQFAWDAPFSGGLWYLDAQHADRPMNTYLYGLAIAPYYGLFDDSPGLSAENIFQQLLITGNAYGKNSDYELINRTARLHGLHAVAYEGGPGTFGNNNIQAKYDASLDPRFAQVNRDYLEDWYSQGGDLFNWFIAGPTNWLQPYGTWGLTNRADNLTSPKIIGTTAVANAEPVNLSTGIVVPQRWDPRWTSGTAKPEGNIAVNSPAVRDRLDYNIRVPRSGTYKLSLNAAAVANGESVDLWINGTVERSFSMANTGSWSNYVDTVLDNLELQEGLITLSLRVVGRSQGFSLKQLEIAAVPSTDTGAPDTRILNPVTTAK